MSIDAAEHNIEQPFMEFRARLQELDLPYINGVAINLCPRCFLAMLRTAQRYVGGVGQVGTTVRFMGFICHCVNDEAQCFLHLQR